MFRTLAIVIALAAAPAAAQKPRLEVKVSPRLAIFDTLRGTEVMVTIIVNNVDEAYWCPAIGIDWGTGERPSIHQSDCDPYEESSADERARWAEIVRHKYTRSGIYEVTVALLKSGKPVKNGKREITIELR